MADQTRLILLKGTVYKSQLYKSIVYPNTNIDNNYNFE